MTHLDGQFKEWGDLNLYYQCWLPDDEPKAILLVVHGLAEHSGRYRNLVDCFVPKGYAVYGFDQRGHGKSDGLRGYIGRFSYFVDDLDIFLSLVRSRHHDAKIFLVGHSLGSTIATTYAISHQDELEGLMLSATILKAGASVPSGLIIIARLLYFLLPKAGLYTIAASAISRDQAVVNAYINDPLVYRGKISTRLGIEIIKVMRALSLQIPRIHLPILIMHGAADRLSDPTGSETLYQKASSVDKTFKVYEGYYHEIFNEPGHEQVLADMEAWLAARV